MVRHVYIDVTNTLAVPFTSGVQRVVRRLLQHLFAIEGVALKFVPVTYCDACGAWRRLDVNELAELQGTNRPRVVRANPISRAASWMVGLVTALMGEACAKRIVDPVRLIRDLWSHPAEHAGLKIGMPEPGSIFLDMESSWHNRQSRAVLLPMLVRREVVVCTFHYDLIPVLFPEMVQPLAAKRFHEHLTAHLKYSSMFICISRRVEQDLQAYARRLEKPMRISSCTVAMGSDFSATKDAGPRPEETDRFGMGRLILCVGTIEPRKNHGLLLDVFDRLSSEYDDLTLVLAGRRGWLAQDTIRRIVTHPLRGRRLFWLEQATDEMLEWLYRRAYLSVVASYYEGYGLPVAESLSRGCPTLSSTAGALPEAGGQYADYFDPGSREQLESGIKYYLDNEEAHAEKCSRLAAYRPVPWRETADQVRVCLNSIEAPGGQ